MQRQPPQLPAQGRWSVSTGTGPLPSPPASDASNGEAIFNAQKDQRHSAWHGSGTQAVPSAAPVPPQLTNTQANTSHPPGPSQAPAPNNFQSNICLGKIASWEEHLGQQTLVRTDFGRVLALLRSSCAPPASQPMAMIHDPFYVVLNQIICMNARSAEQLPLVFRSIPGFHFSCQFLSDIMLPQNVSLQEYVQYFSTFPTGSHFASNSELSYYTEVLDQVKWMIQGLATHYHGLLNSCTERKLPPTPDEIRSFIAPYSPTLQFLVFDTIFRLHVFPLCKCSRKVVAGTIHAFRVGQQYPAYRGAEGQGNGPAPHLVYQDLHHHNQSKVPDSSSTTAPRNQGPQIPVAGHNPDKAVFTPGGRRFSFNKHTLGHQPPALPNNPLNGTTNVGNNVHGRNGVATTPPIASNPGTSNPAPPGQPYTTSSTSGTNFVPSGHAASPIATVPSVAQPQRIPLANVQVRVADKAAQRLESLESNSIPGRPPGKRKVLQRDSQTPATPLMPLPGVQGTLVSIPDPRMYALHQVHVRAPVVELTRPGEAPITSQLRRYQYVSEVRYPTKVIDSTTRVEETTLYVPEDEMQSIPQDFFGNNGRQRPLKDNSTLFRLRCVSGRRPNSIHNWAVRETYWPPNLYFTINGRRLEPRRKLHHGKDLPIDINSDLRQGNGLKLNHTLKVVSNMRSDDLKCYSIGVEVLRLMGHDEIRRRCRSHPFTVEDTKRLLGGRGSNGDDEIVETSFTVSIVDPILGTQIPTTPVRGPACTHPSCFDLEAFLRTRNPAPVIDTRSAEDRVNHSLYVSDADVWNCPICGGDARPSVLRFDEHMNSVRERLRADQQLTTAKSIVVQLDGSWKLAQPAKGDGPSSRRASNAVRTSLPSRAESDYVVLSDDDDK